MWTKPVISLFIPLTMLGMLTKKKLKVFCETDKMKDFFLNAGGQGHKSEAYFNNS